MRQQPDCKTKIMKCIEVTIQEPFLLAMVYGLIRIERVTTRSNMFKSTKGFKIAPLIL